MYIPTNKNPGLYKTGYLQSAEGIQTAFKYKTLDREDIERIYAATGLEINKAKRVIATMSGINFAPRMFVVLDGVKYQIENISKEPHEYENGMFTESINGMTYLSLNK